MRKNITGKTKEGEKPRKAAGGRKTIGLDIGDRSSRMCELNSDGSIANEASMATTTKSMQQVFASMPRARIALEVGTHSPWISRLLNQLGHEVIVANARRIRLITESSRKNDRMDARMLARLARVDPELLHPIRHRGEQTQMHLMSIRVRAELIRSRTAMINCARGLTKAIGERLPACDADSMQIERMSELPVELRHMLKPLVELIEAATEKIEEKDKQLEQIAREHYPETELLRQVYGVGTLIALTFVLTIADKDRFEKSRDVGCYVGLQPKRSQSGERDPQLGIAKEGDKYLRTMLVQAAHLVLNKRGPDTDLKRWGLKLASHGGANAKKRAIVAVARKLAVLLHRLWVTGEVYEPLRNERIRQGQTKAA